VVFATYFPARALLVTTKPILLRLPTAGESLSPRDLYDAVAIAVDSTGAITIAGSTNSSTLPVSSQSYSPQCNCTNLNSVAFIARVAPGGAKLVWGTYVPLSSAPTYRSVNPGVPVDTINAVALDSSGNVVFTGVAAAGFPVSSDALQSAFPSGPAGPGITYAGYIAKLNSNGSSGFLHMFGSAGQLATQNAPASVALDSAGNIWITGTTFSPSSLPAPAGTPLVGNSYIAGLAPAALWFP